MNTVISKDGTRIAYEPAVTVLPSSWSTARWAAVRIGSNVATAPLLAPHFKKEEEEWNLGSMC
jgi:hypothetical protein